MKRSMLWILSTGFVMIGLVGCGISDDEEGAQPDPTPTAEQSIQPPGSFSNDREAMLENIPESPSADTPPSASAGDDGEIENPRDDAHREKNPEDRRDKAGARKAMDRGLKASEALDDGFLEQYTVPEDFDEMDALSLDWWSERDEAVGERIAEIATSFDPVEDFNRDEAWVRASHLMSPTAQLDAVDQYPGIDASWVSAQKCHADVEVFVEYQSAVVEDSVQTLPSFQVLAEYRWVDGDDGCDITQPDYFYEYDMSLGSDSKATRIDRTSLDDSIHDRPSGWDM